jgi:hypothetical protein
MSAATEATLNELLVNNRTMAQAIIRMANKMGADTSGIADASDSLGGLGEEGKDLTDKFKQIAKAVGSSVKAVYDLGAQSSNTGVSLSSFYTSLASLLPKDGVFQGFALKIAEISKEFEGNQKVYNDLINVGATFNGSLMNVATTAGKAYMTMDQFANVVKNNTDVFRLMGGSVQTGMTRFVDIQNQMLGEKSTYAKTINALTGGSQGAADALAGYMRTQGAMNKESLMNDKVILEGTISYARNLDSLSKITGKRKEQIEKEAAEVAAEESFQQYLASLDATKAAAARQAVDSARAIFGKDVAEQVRTSLQSGVIAPLTDGQRTMDVMTSGATTKFVEQIMESVNNGKKAEAVHLETIALGKEAAVNLRQFNEDQRAILAVNATTQSGLQAAATSTLGQYDRLSKGLSASQIVEKIQKQQADLEKGSAVALTGAQQRIQELGAKVLELREKILDPIVSSMSKLTGQFVGTITDVLKSDFVTKLSDELGAALSNLNEKIQSGELVNELKAKIKGFYDKLTAIFDAEGITGTISAAFDFGSFTANVVSEAANGVIQGFNSIFTPLLLAMFTKITDYAMEIIERFVPGVSSVDKEIEKTTAQLAQVNKKLEAAQAAKAAGKSTFGIRIADQEKMAKELEEKLKGLEAKKAARSMTFSDLVDKYKKEYQPATPTTTVPAVQPPAGSSPATTSEPTGSTVDGQKLGVLTPDVVNKLVTSNKELADVLNTRLTELVRYTQMNNDNTSRAVSAINRLSGDGFAAVA